MLFIPRHQTFLTDLLFVVGIVDYFTVTGKPMAPDIHMVVTLDDGSKS